MLRRTINEFSRRGKLATCRVPKRYQQKYTSLFNTSSDVSVSSIKSFFGKETPPDPNKDKKKRKEEEEPGESTNSQLFGGIMGILVLLVFFNYMDNKVEEKDCQAKLLADMAPGTHPGSDHIKRVKMTHRLPMAELTRNGVEHAALEGTLWSCSDMNDTSYTGKVYQQQYWNDEAAYELTAEAALKLRSATEELHAMCLEAVDTVVESDALMTLFEIPPNMWEEVRRSWRSRERDFLGRFDFMWDGRGEPKLAEYNADTPTILVETAVGQKLWSEFMQSKSVTAGWTFNNIEEQLLVSWKSFFALANAASVSSSVYSSPISSDTTISEIQQSIGLQQQQPILHLAGVYDAVEEREHLRFLGKIAKAAGYQVQYVDISHLDMLQDTLVAVKLQIGSAYVNRVEGIGYEPVTNIFKLYPYEWLSHEALGVKVFKGQSLAQDANSRVRWLEPAWKLILGNKAILAVLWEKFPNHPNLLPAYFELPVNNELPSSTMTDGINYVAKPKFGREGQGIVYGNKYTYASDFVTAAEQQIYAGPSSLPAADAADSDHIYLGYPVYQQYLSTATFSMRHIVIGSWVIGGVPSGFNIREDSTATTQDSSCFVPHYIKGAPASQDFSRVKGHKFTARQRQFYKELYDIDIAAPASSMENGQATTSTHRHGGSSSGWFGGKSSGKDSTATSSGQDNKTHQEKTSNTTKEQAHAHKTAAERFAKRSQAGGHHHFHASQSKRATGSSFKTAASRSSGGGSGSGSRSAGGGRGG